MFVLWHGTYLFFVLLLYNESDTLWACLLIGSVLLSVSLIHSLLYFELRHRWLLEPMLAIFASIGMLKYFDGSANPDQSVSR